MALTVPPMFENHWNPPAGLSEIDALVYRSNLLAWSAHHRSQRIGNFRI